MVLAAVSPTRLLGALVACLCLAPAATATAAPPPNDSPATPGTFDSVTAENGTPADKQAIADLAEATADLGVPHCLGPSSFTRTVWYVVPASEQPHEITVEATGRRLDVVDLAAFVQPEGATGPLTSQPNACAGTGSGGADAAEEPSSGVTLRVPPRRTVLIQVGRHGTIRSADDERALVTLDDRPFAAPNGTLPGDFIAGAATPKAHITQNTIVPLFGATLSEEDPAEPVCPSLGSVWRRVVPTANEQKLISVQGGDATTLTVFAGGSPTADNALDCVNRVGHGQMEMSVPARRRQPLWIRIGTDRPPDQSSATFTITPGAGAFVVDGGPGGSDPTPGGPGGGFPTDCANGDAERASITGALFRGKVKQLNRRGAVVVPLTLKNGPVCDVQIDLVGPGGRTYAVARMLRLKTGKRRLRLQRVDRLRRGGYHLRATGLSQLGDLVPVKSKLRGRFT
jgi:hypothetical protein